MAKRKYKKTAKKKSRYNKYYPALRLENGGDINTSMQSTGMQQGVDTVGSIVPFYGISKGATQLAFKGAMNRRKDAAQSLAYEAQVQDQLLDSKQVQDVSRVVARGQ